MIDATNPVDFSKDIRVRTSTSLFAGTTNSLGDRVQCLLPTAKVVRCFNTVNDQTMNNPKMKEGLSDTVICRNNEGAKRKVASILTSHTI